MEDGQWLSKEDKTMMESLKKELADLKIEHKKFAKSKGSLSIEEKEKWRINSQRTNQIFIQITDYLKFLIGERIFLLLFFVKFPLIILNLTLLQNILPNLGRSFRLFGEISYTVYLVHFPVEIIFSLINNNIYNLNFSANYIFITYLFSVFLISYLIFIFYENPMKELIRFKFLKN